jgi:sugar phosphate isomerase/epimerase
MDRRSFLAHASAAPALAALAWTRSLEASSPRDGAERKGANPAGLKPSSYTERVAGHGFLLSCSAYSFRDLLPGRRTDPRMSLEAFIDFCAAQGLAGVELTSYFFPRTDPEYLLSLKRRAFLNGLVITGTPVGNNFCLPPGSERDAQLQLVRDWVDRAALLGAPCVRIFAGSAPRGGSEAEARGWCLECLSIACGHASGKGVVLALENHGGIVSGAEQLVSLVEAVRSPWLGVNLDTGNFDATGKDPYEEVERAAHLAVVVQLKVEMPTKEGRKAAADLGRLLDILRRASYRGAIALEYEAAEDPLKAVPRHLAELRARIREG